MPPRKTFAAFVALLCVPALFGAEYHVFANKPDAPFRTIGQAVSRLQPGDVCVIHAGVYRETVALPRSGEPKRPIRLVAAGDGPVVVSGLEPLALDWDVQGGSWTAPMTKPPAQLFFGDQMAREAHTPNGAHGGVMDRPCFHAEKGTGYEGITCTTLPDGDYAGGYVLIWRGGAWTNATVKIKDYTPGQSLTFETPFTSHSDKYHRGDAFKPKPGNRFLLLGSRAALDAPGEWLADPAAGRILFVPPAGKEPGDLTFEAKARDYTLVLKGRSHIEIKGIHFHGGAMDLTMASHCVLENCESTYSSHFTRTARKVPAHPVNTVSGDRNIFRRCRIAYSAGAGLILLGEGNQILNCVFHDLGYMGTYEAALQINRSKGTVVDHCSIYRAGRGLIQHHGAQRMRITYCDLHHANMLSNDVGATYAWGTDGEGSVIAYNWVHHNLGTNTAGIYLDNFCKNFQVHHNVVWQTQSTAIRLNSDALNHLVANNTVAQSPTAFSTFAYHAYTLTQKDTRLINNLTLCAFDPTSPRHVAQGETAPILKANLAGAIGETGMPTVDSQAVDAGVEIPGITDGFVGKAPDVGAYERGAPYWRPGADWDPNPTTPDLAFIPQAPITETTMPREGLLLWLDGKASKTVETEDGEARRWHHRLDPQTAATAGAGCTLLPMGGVRSAGKSGLKVGTLRKKAGPATVFVVARSESAGSPPWQRLFVSWSGKGNDWVAPNFQLMRPNAKAPTAFSWRLFSAKQKAVVLDHITLAASAQETSQNFVGDLGEVLVFDHAIPFDREQAIVDYLRRKWGMGARGE
jgi:hypothetical protein